MFRSLLRHWFQPQAPRTSRRQNRFRPTVRSLEERRLLSASVYHWTAGASGDFNVAGNWTGPNNVHAVPGPADIAFNDTNYTITITSDASVGAWEDGVHNFTGQPIISAGATLTLTGQGGNSEMWELNLPAGGTLQLQSGLVQLGHIQTAGTIEADAGATVQFNSPYSGALDN